jgi:ATP-dependent DNA ligase
MIHFCAMRRPSGRPFPFCGSTNGFAFCSGGSYSPLMFWRSPSPARRPPGFIEPCLPTLAHAVPSGSQWAYEIKHDGFRFICRRDGDSVRVFSRRG